MKKKNINQINHSLLEGMGNQTVSKPSDYARIRSWGDKNHATTHDGLQVERQDYIFVEGYGMVRMCPYELHFLFEDKSKKVGRWAYLCTCGSIAGVVSYKELKGLLSPELGEYIMVCIHHMATKQNTGLGSHADGSHE